MGSLVELEKPRSCWGFSGCFDLKTPKFKRLKVGLDFYEPIRHQLADRLELRN